MSNQPHQSSGHGMDTAGGSGSAAASTGTPADKTLLTPYVLEPPEWRAPLLANKSPALYPDFFPGATALYPQLATQSAGHVPGISRDSSAGASGSQLIPVAGFTASKEDELNETVAKLGFVNRAVVQTENFSAHTLIHNKLHNGPSIHALGKIIQRVLERQRTDENLLPEPGPWTYKAPSRVVYNATRLESWYAELANPAVPLSKLAKNIPSAPSSSSQSIMSTGTGTYTGSTSSPGPAPAASKFSGTAMDKNLEMLINRQVPLYRAIWFLQAVGQNDIAQMSKAKNLQIHPILSYSADYTGALVESLKRQIGEAVLPLTQTAGAGRLLPGMSVKGRPRNILAEEHSRERWLAKWNYTLELLSASLDEGMLDRQRLCSLLLQQMQPQTRLQMLWWLSVILQTTIDDMLATAWMSKALVIVLFEWLQCLDETAAAKDDTTVICHTVARSLLRHIWLTDSDMFLVPQIWSKESDADQLKSALGIGGDGDAAYDDSLLWNELEQRANILLCKGGPATKLYTSLLCDAPDARTLSKGGVASQEWTTAASEVVRLLDMWTGTESIESITSTLLNFSFSSNLSGVAEETSNYHDSCSDHPTSLHPEVVKLLLCWATTTTRHGDHRAYLVNSILASYLGLPPRISLLPSLPGDAVLNDLPSTDMDRFEALQDCIMQWIDCQEQSLSGEAQSSSLIEWTSREATLSMCYLLLNSKVLDISGLVQKVIARGSTHTGDFHGEGIYVQILKDYGGSSKRAALRWQMGRVSVDGKAVDESKTLENAQAIIQRELQPLLQQLRNAEEGTQYRLPPLEIEDIRAGLSSLSVMKKVWLLTTWLVPIVHEALQANQSRRVPITVLLSLLEFCQSLKTYELAAYLLIETLQKFTLTPDLMETLVSFHHLNYLVLAAMQDLPTYASSLFVALQNLDTDKDPGPFVLSEMVSLGRHLSTSQLRMLRRKIHHWRSQSSMPASVPYMLSPPEDHDLTHHSPADLVARIQAFCLAYNKNPNDINNMLAGLLSTGPPLDLTGAIIPAVMQALLDLPQGRATFEPLLLLCSAAAQMPSSSSLKVHRNTAEEAWRALPSFSSAHGVFVQDLIVKNILSIGLVLDNICYPLLLQYSIHSPSESSISNLLDIITDLLLDHARNSPRVWRVRAAKSALYGHKSFLSAYHLAIQLSYIVYNQQNEAWWSQSRRIYERILGQPMFQTAFLRHLEEKNVTGKFPQGLSHGELTLLWDALVALVRSYCKGGLQTTSASEDTRFLAISAALLKHGAIYAPFVTSLGRCFFKTLVLRISQSASSTSAGLPPRALPRSVVEQYLQHLLEAPESSRQAQLTMFREYIGDDVCSSFFSLLQLAEICPCLTFKLLVSMFEMLSKKLELYRGDLQALVGLEEWESGLDKLRQIAQVTSLIASSRGTKETCSANLVDEDILRAVMQSAAGILSIVTPSLPTTLARSPLGHFLVIVTSDIVGLVRKWGGTALDATDMMRDFTTSLCFWCQDMPARQDFAQHIQDVLGWLLQSMPAASRNVVLNRFQISTASNDSARPQAISKQLSLGPSPLLNSVREGEERYITLQNSWRGISVKGNAPALDMKSNNEPIDFHKYQCRTGDIARHLQPKYRAKDRGSWSSFDSEIPWNNGTTPQRDFRRSTTTQLDFAPATQAQILRTRGSTQPDIGVHHLKGTSTHHSHNAKQSDKEKIGEGHSRDAATKKRKTVPDVVLIEESSPKKKVKTASNTTLPSGTKQVKNKS